MIRLLKLLLDTPLSICEMREVCRRLNSGKNLGHLAKRRLHWRWQITKLQRGLWCFEDDRNPVGPGVEQLRLRRLPLCELVDAGFAMPLQNPSPEIADLDEATEIRDRVHMCWLEFISGKSPQVA